MTKKLGFIILVTVAAFALASCGRREQPLEEMQEPVAMEALTSMNASSAVAPAPQEAKPVVTPAEEPATVTAAGFVKPTGEEIQTALKNSGFYSGAIDGKVGPMTKKAIEEFQKANNLKVDGKVGPQTWAILSTHVNPPAEGKKKR